MFYLRFVPSAILCCVHVNKLSPLFHKVHTSSRLIYVAMGEKEILYPRKAGQFIAENSKDVSINKDGIKSTAEKVMDMMKKNPKCFSVDRWDTHVLNPTSKDKEAIDWIFLADTLNFSFWSDDESNKYCVKYKDQSHTGYWSLCAAIKRAIDEGIQLTDPNYYADITKDQLQNIFRSDSDIKMPLLERRLEVLHEVGNVLKQKYGGTFLNVIIAADKSAQNLLTAIVDNFPCFRDVAQLQGQKVAIYKRAQILIGDIWAACQGQGYGEFTDIDTITMFADYRIPQALVWFDILKYSDSLMDKLKKDVMFESGEREEVEIRGCSIWAVELLVEEVRRMRASDLDVPKDVHINAIVLDHFFWDYRREHAVDTQHIPIHKTRCIYY